MEYKKLDAPVQPFFSRRYQSSAVTVDDPAGASPTSQHIARHIHMTYVVYVYDICGICMWHMWNMYMKKNGINAVISFEKCRNNIID